MAPMSHCWLRTRLIYNTCGNRIGWTWSTTVQRPPDEAISRGSGVDAGPIHLDQPLHPFFAICIHSQLFPISVCHYYTTSILIIMSTVVIINMVIINIVFINMDIIDKNLCQISPGPQSDCPHWQCPHLASKAKQIWKMRWNFLTLWYQNYN